jgi:hypothetical protein
MTWNYEGLESFVGKTVTEISDFKVGSDKVRFVCDDGSSYAMYHQQDCCENVYLDDFAGDCNDLIGAPILVAEEASSKDLPNRGGELDGDDSYTWTFYNFRTVKGAVSVRWYGCSNGYYSEAVSFERERDDEGDD